MSGKNVRKVESFIQRSLFSCRTVDLQFVYGFTLILGEEAEVVLTEVPLMSRHLGGGPSSKS